MNNKEMPILLLTGYLGSGKTTLVNRILSNKKGIRFAVIVNDIGEVNIDATLIQQGGVVGQSDDSLVALQNGCICCTLKTDLMNQIVEIMKMDKFDYIVIEASGICEPEPIAQTICSMKSIGGVYTEFGTPRLDCLVTVVDALRMADEFGCGESLERKNLEEDDIENLIIQQIEFCNVILLNKASEVSPGALDKIKHIIREIQTKAQIIECDYADVDLENCSIPICSTTVRQSREQAGSAVWKAMSMTRSITTRSMKRNMSIITRNMRNIIMTMMKSTMTTTITRNITTITMITTTKAVKSRNMESEHLSISEGRHLT